MYCITDEQIDYILNDIRRNGVDTEDLQLNLLDHVCCIIEQRLKETDDFERFYHDTIRSFYRRELREIEEETINLLTFKNYYSMKKVMIVSGAIAAAALISGSIFKAMWWPGANVLLVSGIVLVSLLFLPLVAVLRVREVNSSRDKFVAVVGSLLGLLYAMSTLFAVMHWPGSKAMWLTTVCVSMFIFIPVYFFTGIRKPELKMNTIITSVLFVGVTVLLFTMIGIKPNRQARMQVYTYLQNQALLKKMQQHARPDASDAGRVAASINSACDNAKAMLIKRDMGSPTVPADFEEKDIVFHERVGDLSTSAAAVTLFGSLKEAVKKYNELQTADNRIPPETVALLEVDQFQNYSSYLVLENLTRLQMYLTSASPANANTVSMK